MQLNWHYIHSLGQGAESGTEEQQRHQCKMYRFAEVTLSKKANLENEMTFMGNAFTVIKAGDDILNHICHS